MDHCKHCGKRWTEHYGVEPTCRRLQKARTALRVVSELLKLKAYTRLKNVVNVALMETGDTE